MKKLLLITLLGASLASVQATQVWDWSFGTESGQFVTDGTGTSPGTYTMQDFIVTTSAVGGTIGSLSGGAYATDVFVTYQPFSFEWNGTSVTKWNQSGYNTFDWWAFNDVPGPGMYFFGWNLGNINDPTSGAYWRDNMGLDSALALGTISVTPASQPMPDAGSSLAMLGGVFAFMGALGRKLRK
jgi:hypothetical protein